jgi:hypothetical protein
MDANQAALLTKLLLQYHADNIKKIASHRPYKKFSHFSDVNVGRTQAPITFYAGSQPVLVRDLQAFLQYPKKDGHTPYIILDIDTRNDWLKLLRFVGSPNGELNAESVCLVFDPKETKTNGFGYRYEHPERFEDNHHGFFHIQPILRTSSAVDIPGAVDWLPVNFPTFYMLASCAYELAIFSIHSLAGWEQLQKYQLDNMDDNAVLRMLIRVGHSSRDPFLFSSPSLAVAEGHV